MTKRFLTRLAAGVTLLLASTPAFALRILTAREETTQHSVLILLDTIVNGDDKELRETIADEKKDGFKVIRIELGDVPGGAYLMGFKLADAISATGVPVLLHGDCASACTPIALKALMDGRLFVSRTTRLGFHRAAENGRDCGRPCWAPFSEWAQRNGVPLSFTDAAINTPHDRIKWFGTGDLVKLGATVVAN